MNKSPSQPAELIMLDTSTLLEDVRIMDFIYMKGCIPVIAEVVFDELDNHKSDAGRVGLNARTFIRSTESVYKSKPAELLNGKRVLEGDSFFEYEWKGQPYYMINSTNRLRKTLRKNDKIIYQTASDYALRLRSNDLAMRTSASVNKVEVDYSKIEDRDFQEAELWIAEKLQKDRPVAEYVLKKTLAESPEVQEIRKMMCKMQIKTRPDSPKDKEISDMEKALESMKNEVPKEKTTTKTKILIGILGVVGGLVVSTLNS